MGEGRGGVGWEDPDWVFWLVRKDSGVSRGTHSRGHLGRPSGGCNQPGWLQKGGEPPAAGAPLSGSVGVHLVNVELVRRITFWRV